MTLFALAMISFVTERRGETRGSCRCLGTGPRNYGYRSNYYPGFARYEGVAEERKRSPSRADSRSVLLTVDEIDELSLSLSLCPPTFRETFLSPPSPSWREKN